jgi:hypothetical protein
VASISEFKERWRVAGIVLLIFALIGPWTYEVVNVPAEYSCNAPYVRLEGDFCGEAVSGFWLIFWLAQGLIDNLAGLLTGTVSFAGRGREFLFMFLPVFLLLPLLSTLLVIWRQDSRGLNAFQLAAWGLAAIPTLLWLIISLDSALRSLLWGAWIYIGLVSVMLLLESLALIDARKERQRI